MAEQQKGIVVELVDSLFSMMWESIWGFLIGLWLLGLGWAVPIALIAEYAVEPVGGSVFYFAQQGAHFWILAPVFVLLAIVFGPIFAACS
jgi:hypothetical protein